MKSMFFLFVIIVLFSCTDSEIKEINNSLSKVEKTITEEQNNVINVIAQSFIPEELQKEEQKRWNSKSRSAQEQFKFLSAEAFKKLKFKTLPYYVLNENLFLNDPSPENLMNCIELSQNRILFLGREGKDIAAITESVRLNDKWIRGIHLEGIEYFKENFAWFPQNVSVADENGFYFLNAIGSLYVVISYDGDPCFFSFIGSYKYNKKEFASIMLNKKNTNDRNKQYFKQLDLEINSIRK